jgi:hypothetical protein
MNDPRIAANLAAVEAHFHFEMRDGKIARELVYDMGRPGS